jgi:BirA family biotin operon repressor/biotin-[acetyl-CoA-carboxylase] ligase
MSLLYRGYAGHRKPWLIGMAVALAVARVADGRVRWPNDVVRDGRKVAGVLTELVGDPVRVPVIGVGLNLRYSSFLAGLEMAGSVNAESDAEEVARQIVAEIERVPEPSNWASISQLWFDLDDTPGKAYRLHSGELAVALRVGNDGSLVCSVNGEQRSVMAAEAILGPVL